MVTTGRMLRGRGRVLALGALAISLVISVSVSTVFAAKKVEAPTITSGPAGPTSSTNASFTFTQSSSNVTFECALDSATAYVGCGASSPGSKSYTGLSQGSHTFRVRARVNGIASGPASRTWTVDTIAPPATIVTDGPSDPSNNQSVGFDYVVTVTEVDFQCRLDASPFQACGPNHTEYTHVELGEHCFRVRAVDAAGNVGPSSDAWCWTTVTDEFPIAGSAPDLFYPGTEQRIDVEIGNPYNFDLVVTAVDITVEADTTNVGCLGSKHLKVIEPLDTTSSGVVIPEHSTVTLSDLGIPVERWPLVRMVNLDENQDACKNAAFTLTYDGTATK